MKRVLVGIKIVCFLVFAVALARQAQCDPFVSYPGTKARSMGSAFVAVADDISSIWYNPAGFSKKSKILAEVSTATEVDDFHVASDGQILSYGNYDSTNWTYFVGGVFSRNTWNFSLALFQPYQIQWGINLRDEGISGKLDEDMTVGSFGISKRLEFRTGKSFLPYGSIGGTVEYINIDGKDSNLYAYSYGNWYRLDEDDLSENAVSGSVGILLTLFELKKGTKGAANFKVNLGAVYRFKSSKDLSATSTINSEKFKAVAFKKPQSWDVGLSLIKKVFSRWRLTLSGQYGEVDYGSGVDYYDFKYRKYSFGGELYSAFAMKFFKGLALRGGYYLSEATDEKFNLWPDVYAFTFGAGLQLTKNFIIDAAYEIRHLGNYGEDVDFDIDDVNLFSVALRWAF